MGYPLNLLKIKSGFELLNQSAFSRTGGAADRKNPALALPQIFNRLGQFGHLHLSADQIGSQPGEAAYGDKLSL